MLQASSPLSRVCGHSHFKKFWLMQTQKEAQASVACEKNANLAMSSSRCVPSPPVRGPDSKHDSRWGSGTPSMPTLLREGSSTRNPSSGCGAGKHVSLVTCAESLTSPLQTEPACQSLNQKRSYLNIKDLNNNAEDGFRQPYGAGKSNDIIVTNPPVVNGSKSRVCSSIGSVSKQPNIYPEDAIKSPDPSGSLRLGLDEFRSSSGHQNLVQEANEVKSQGLADLSSKQKDFDPVEECMKFSKRSLAPVSVDNYRGSKDFCKTSKFSTDQESHMSLSRVPMQSEMDKRRDKNALSDDAYDDNDDDDSEDGLLEDGKVQDLSKLDSNGVRSCLRTCSHCGTTKTPLWRSGPHGPKSLCNACGIRFKKSRRYIGPVTEGLDSPTSPNSSRSVSKSLKRKQEFTMESHLAHPQEEDVVGTPAIHKRSRWPVRLSLKKDCLGHQADEAVGAESCLTWTIPSETFSSRSRFKLNSKDPKRIKEEINLARMFARDEDEEAAVLLMALSCGLVNA